MVQVGRGGLVGAVVAGALTGCTLDLEALSSTVPGLDDSTVAGATDVGEEPPGAEPTAAAVRRATRHLDGLRVTERPHGTDGYARHAFGTAWKDIDGNGCNQRDDVLLRDAVPGSTRVAQQGRCDHDVIAGTFVDPYSGRRHELDDLKDPRQAQAVQIDHVVPLAEAWVSGASTWAAQDRERYANTLTNLLAVDGPTNASKGASDPAAWRPRKGYQCRYAVRWVTVKHRWDLAVDGSEKKALTEMLGHCA